ncbi:uncharacterized protein [Dendrobates tinctorius]|uniref:uncharacterized protein n=1 Tax=Dendrobates tinctorius TaxID=92724 RepID=UPI003CCA40CB
MAFLKLGLVSALLYLVTVATGEPSCADVEDFGHCTGDTGDFCPSGIACSCRSSRPFCSCPYYTGPNGNYWYLGEKCDQLWSTLDMIVICVFPAVALAFIVAVTAQLIHFCKMKPYSKTVKVAKNLEIKRTSTYPNRTYVPDLEEVRQYKDQSMVNVQEQVQPKIQTAQWMAPRADPPKPRRLNYYSDVPPVGRSSNYFEGRQQSQNYGHRLPEQDFHGYDQQQQYSRISRAAPAPADYLQRSPEPSSPNTAWDSRPFSFARPQVKAVYDY